MTYLATVYTELLCHYITEIEAILDNEPAILNDPAENDIRQNLLSVANSDALIVHREGKIILASQAASEIYGAETVGQLIGTDAIKLVHPDDRTFIFSRRFDLFNGRPLKPIRRKGLRLDGSEFTCESHCTQRIWGGAPMVFYVVRLIADHKPAQETLSALPYSPRRGMSQTG